MKLKDFMAAMQAIETDRKLSKEVVVEALQEALAKAFRSILKYRMRWYAWMSTKNPVISRSISSV